MKAFLNRPGSEQHKKVDVMAAVLPQTGRSVLISVLPHVAGIRTHITLT